MSARMVAAADGGGGDLLSWVARYGDEASCEEGLMRLCLVKPDFWFGAGTAFPYLAARLRGPSSACIVGGSSSPASA